MSRMSTAQHVCGTSTGISELPSEQTPGYATVRFQVMMSENDVPLRNDLAVLAAQHGWHLAEGRLLLVPGSQADGLSRLLRFDESRVTAVVFLSPGAWRLSERANPHPSSRLDERLPLVLVAPFPEHFELRKAQALGVESLLLKPYEPTRLCEALLKIRQATQLEVPVGAGETPS